MAEIKEIENVDKAPGWQAIDEAIHRIYANQVPLHWGTQQPYQLGGPDPLDGVSAFKSEMGLPHWHFVSYGLSELYSKVSQNSEISGYGIEFTFRLTRSADGQQPPTWVFNFLQNLARYVFKTGNVFDVGHRMHAKGPISLDHPTDIHAVVFALDPQLGEINTPHGHLKFLQIVGITSDELTTMQQWTSAGFLEVLAGGNPLLITDLGRKSLLNNPETATLIQQRIKSDSSTKKGLFGRLFQK